MEEEGVAIVGASLSSGEWVVCGEWVCGVGVEVVAIVVSGEWVVCDEWRV